MIRAFQMGENLACALTYLGESPGKWRGHDTRQRGLPTVSCAAVRRLAERLAVPAERILSVADISPRTYARRQAKGEPLTVAESDRVLRIARVAAVAERVFGAPAKAHRWLSSARPILGARPLDLLGTDAGSRDVENELQRIEFGDFA